jgi:predicted esterase
MASISQSNNEMLHVLQTALLFILLSTKVYSISNESSVLTNIVHLKNTTYEIIPQSQWMQLKAIRDSIGAITGLDTLYENRTHPNGMPYHIYIPKNLQPDVDYPLVIFLHGYTDLTLNTHNGFPKGVWSLPMFQNKHPHILFLPHYRNNSDHWLNENYRNMFYETLNNLIVELNNNSALANIDTTRIYLTGFSQGGMGTWNYIMNSPHKFAAAAPLSGFYVGPQNISDAELIMNIPIWIFNGDSDNGVDGSRISYNMLIEAGAHDVRYHEYQNHGHVIDDFAYFTEGFLDWLFSQSLNLTDVIDKSGWYPVNFELHQNYPNPFNPTTTISYELPKSSFVKLSIYNINGRLVATLVNEKKNAGYYSVEWNVEKVSSGIYFYQINAGDFTSTGKCLLLK